MRGMGGSLFLGVVISRGKRNGGREVQHEILLKLLFYTAVRVSELVHIEVGDVDLDACKVFINRGKSAKDRYILFPASFRLVLKSHLHAAQSIFSCPSGLMRSSEPAAVISESI
jgi:site-specific recombinase XerD